MQHKLAPPLLPQLLPPLWLFQAPVLRPSPTTLQGSPAAASVFCRLPPPCSASLASAMAAPSPAAPAAAGVASPAAGGSADMSRSRFLPALPGAALSLSPSSLDALDAARRRAGSRAASARIRARPNRCCSISWNISAKRDTSKACSLQQKQQRGAGGEMVVRRQHGLAWQCQQSGVPRRARPALANEARAGSKSRPHP